jgi:uncharacterized protein (TIGR03083 family)
MNQVQTADALRAERESLAEYLETLPESAWEKASLCELWKVRDVVSHLAGSAADTLAQLVVNAGSAVLQSPEGIGSPEYNQRQVDERAGNNPAELLDEWAQQGQLLEQFVREIDDELWASPLPVFGTTGLAFWHYIEDVWAHAQDIRVALGEPISDGPGAGVAVREMAILLPGRAKRLAPNLGSVAIEAGDFVRNVEIRDGGVAVKICGDDLTLALVATGRLSLSGAQAQGTVSVEPPDAPAGLDEALNIYGH